MADPWYPPAASYFVPRGDDASFPVRQGDIFEAPEEAGDLAGWRGFMLIHPTCEVAKAPRLQVARLRAVSELADDFQKTVVTYGYRDRHGEIEVAFAHTFWLPPAGDDGPLGEPGFVDFRDVDTVEPDRARSELRARAMSHDARVYLIRRQIYFRYRWHLTLDQVRQLEAQRIRGDTAFEGPRPSWAE